MGILYLSRIRVLCLILPICLFSAVVHGGSLVGQVVDLATRSPIPGVAVVLRETGQKRTTDGEGRFQFDQLGGGRYTISVHHLAFGDVERAVMFSPEINDTLVVAVQPAILVSEVVVVRSLRISPSANTTPYPVDVEMHDRMTQSPRLTLPEMLQDVPGISLVRDGAWETAISIRGMSRSNIVTMIDGTRIETANDIAGALSLFNVHDLERVEILKSSASTHQGTGALGGVVQMVSKRPSFTDHARLGGEVDGDLSSVDGGVSQYLALEQSTADYGLRMSGGYRRGGNTMTPNGELPNSQYRDFSISGSLGIATVASQSAFLTYQRSQAEDTGIPGGAPIAGSARATYKLARRELFLLEYTIPNLVPNWPLLTFKISRQAITRDVEINQSPVLTVTPHAIHTTTSAECEAKFSLTTDMLLTAGVEMWERELESKRERINASLGQIVGERPVPRSRYFSSGLFAQTEWDILPERWTMTLGGRYDWIRTKNDEVWNPEYVLTGETYQNPLTNRRLVWPSGTAHDGSWSADAGVRYALTPDLDITSLLSTAFRSPSLEERFEFIDLGNVVWVGNPNLQPERSLCFNIGVHAHTEGVKARADFFLHYLNNLVAEIPGSFEGRSAFFKSNIGAARLYGFEIANEHLLASWMVVRYSMAYVRGEDTNNHLNLSQIAPIHGRIELDCGLQNVGTLTVAASLAGRQRNLAAGEAGTAGYAIVDLGLAGPPLYECGLALALRGSIRNCFNKGYQNHLSTLRGIVRDEPGRNFTLSLTVTL